MTQNNKNNKPIKCYYCNEIIEKDSELVEKKIPLATKSGVRNYRRKFHIKCLEKFLEEYEDKELRKAENSDWDLVYQYFRKNILGYDNSTPISDQHAIRRLLGLRLGQYYPSGSNTRILKRGYDFKTILITMKVCNPKIQAYLKTATFKNNKHKIDAIMKFITNEIDDVYNRIKAQSKEKEKLDKIKIEQFDSRNNYERKGTGQKNKKAEELFGGLL